MKRSLTENYHLKKSDEIKRAIKTGLVISCYGMKWFYLPNGRVFSRFAVTLKRGYGKAVERNRVKRQVKEIFRTNRDRIKPGFDMVCLIFPKVMSFSERTDQILSLIKRAGLLEEIRNS